MFSVSKKLKKVRNALFEALYCLPSAEQDDANIDQTVRMITATASMGLVAAATAIGLSAARFDMTGLIGTGFLLASTSLVTLGGLVRAQKKNQYFLGNIAAWIALGSATAMYAPVVGVGSIAIALAAYFASSPDGPTLEKMPDMTPLTEKAAVSENLDFITISTNADVKTAGTIDGLSFEEDEKFIERVHVQDRVAFLRSLSALAQGETAHCELSVLINTAAKHKAAKFADFNLALFLQNGAITLSVCDRPTVPEKAGVPATDVAVPNILAVVSHELRTPLNAIIGFSELLQSDVRKNLSEEKRSEYAGLINGAGTHLLTLVNTILDVSKIESGTYSIHRDTFSFRDTARESIAMIAEQARKRNIQINERIARDLDFTNGDRRAVKQILINLLSNAVKYTQDNGIVTLDASVKNETLIFEVSDTGVGMDAGSLEKIGRPFAQVDNEYNRDCEGTGLGLSLVNGLAELHGGRMAIHSKPGVGTRVTITIPPDKFQSDNSFLDGDDALVPLRTAAKVKKDSDAKFENEEVTCDERKIG